MIKNQLYELDNINHHKTIYGFLLSQEKKKDKEPRYYPNEKQYPVEAFEIS
jgi:hypothetical protein